jgi:hypothetical protein
MTHFPTLYAMGRRRNAKHASVPPPKPAPQRPSRATVKPVDDAPGEVQRDQLQRPAPTTQKD